MALKIVRNDISKMAVDAIVNTANKRVTVGEGCDSAVYDAAGYDRLLSYRKENIGEVPEGEVFITPGFNLPAKNIIHAVSPCYIDGNSKEEEKLRGIENNAQVNAIEHIFLNEVELGIGAVKSLGKSVNIELVEFTEQEKLKLSEIEAGA